jgi:hypothetical protein
MSVALTSSVGQNWRHPRIRSNIFSFDLGYKTTRDEFPTKDIFKIDQA